MLFIVLFFYLFALCTLLTFVFGLWYFVARLRLFLFYVFFFFFLFFFFLFFFSSRRRHTRWNCDWSSDVCSSDLARGGLRRRPAQRARRRGRVRDAEPLVDALGRFALDQAPVGPHDQAAAVTAGRGRCRVGRGREQETKQGGGRRPGDRQLPHPLPPRLTCAVSGRLADPRPRRAPSAPAAESRPARCRPRPAARPPGSGPVCTAPGWPRCARRSRPSRSRSRRRRPWRACRRASSRP